MKEGVCEKSEQELVQIADRMLAKLEREYMEVQQQNFKIPGQHEEQEEQINHEDYQIIEGDLEGPEGMSDDEEEADGVGEDKKEENKQLKLDDKGNCGNEKDNDLGDVGELMEVFPTEQWVAPPEKQLSLNCQKIKSNALKMNLPIPAWMQDESLLRNRIFQLFGRKDNNK